MPTPDADRGVLSSFASLSLGAMLKRVARVALAAEGALVVGEQMPALVASPPPSAPPRWVPQAWQLAPNTL